MSSGIIVAIDGFSACGKSTLARDLAARLNYLHVDSGAMYRAVTLYFIEHGINYSHSDEVAESLPQIAIDFRKTDGTRETILNGLNVEERIRARDVNAQVSPVAAISEVRRFLVEQQRRLGRARSIVMDGRDIGTVVFPDAELKIFLIAEFDVRVQRRYDELRMRGPDVSHEQVVEDLRYRDHIDSTRADSPLRQAPDAVVIDNTSLSREDQLSRAYALACARIAELKPLS